MGNCFVRDRQSNYWRICPEELSASVVATNNDELQAVFNDPKYKEDWQLLGLIDHAEEELGPLVAGQCYAMRVPAVIGGLYSVSNLRIGSLYEYLALSGSLAFQVKDAKDGDRVEIRVLK
jgi:hypothetical protein